MIGASEAGLLNKALEYGLGGMVVAAGMILVVGPLIKALIQQQTDALDLLRKAVDSNTKAVEVFTNFEREEGEIHRQLTDTQMEILQQLTRLTTMCHGKKGSG